MKFTLVFSSLLLLAASAIAAPPDRGCERDARPLQQNMRLRCRPHGNASIRITDDRGCPHPDMRGIQDVTVSDGRNHDLAHLRGEEADFRCPDDGDVNVRVNFRGHDDGHYKMVFFG